ncbi:glycoside hydrolase family 43 protein [Paenibacillus sp. 1P07SE]|uniref:glycoside hydrolase family 43 protein n=1 Tax=Paenibacillus sp. 1P07SE TaxID=3132209 RepID=UPI0039A49F8F
MTTITNPILPGFHPDPSIVRVGEDYYLATSTFEWFPGVMIYHSRDLATWTLVSRPLDDVRLLDMRGVPDSGGVWAPCLSYDNGLFYLIYTNVTNKKWPLMDTPNYLTTAPDITGPWSDPVFLNGSGFDPSLFHDSDGTKWLLNMRLDPRKGKQTMAGIVMQQYCPEQQSLIGEVRNIYTGSELGKTEGPHLYKRGDYYYLMTAEGGTGWGHAVSMARSTSIWGPYETDPDNPMLTSEGDETLELQKAGHASYVDTPDGEHYIVHLCGRPLMPERRCNLGRETSIQKVHWTESGWLRLSGGGNRPYVHVEGPAASRAPESTVSGEPSVVWREEFDGDRLDMQLQSLRIPVESSWCSLAERPGYVRLRGRDFLTSLFRQSLLARRQQHKHCEAVTSLDFSPQTPMQTAGLVCYYDTDNFYYLHVTQDEQAGICLRLISRDDGSFDEPLAEPLALAGWAAIYLKVVIEGSSLQYYASEDEESWQAVGPQLDASILSDDYGAGGKYTGSFIGIAVQDQSGQELHADFDYLQYKGWA